MKYIIVYLRPLTAEEEKVTVARMEKERQWIRGTKWVKGMSLIKFNRLYTPINYSAN